ncbi:hypothetical protein VFPPC_12892 [Pochonia chlamydosporia 170]|uniref:Uncharacterized protein n=1 Tax=Pochonia chlamydosporia 170 TaxID=1380566 RepID=A0A179G6C2_METCM|nr:hypothetical protein VFPPC_12892 [Pochonia chlamydosporia 170]OAQ72943.1 hypothetical protein VFPPC_12892 [Pochonia chlamydosporia 170]
MSEYTIPSTWTAPTSCFATTNYYRVLLGGGYFSNEAALPDLLVLVRQVDPRVMVNNVTSNVFSFMCKDNEYGCHATATLGVVWTGTLTDIGLSQPTEEPITRTPYTEEGLEAWGVKLLYVPATATISSVASTNTVPDQLASTTKSTSTPSQTGPPSVSGSLSSGAIAGIAVGSAAVVGLLSLGAFLLYRKKRKAKEAVITHPIAQREEQEKSVQPHRQSRPYQLDAPERRDLVWEMQG